MNTNKKASEFISLVISDAVPWSIENFEKFLENFVPLLLFSPILTFHYFDSAS